MFVLHRLCVNRSLSARLLLTPVITSYFCHIIPTLIRITKPYQANIPIESIYRLGQCIRRCKTEKERCCFFPIPDKNVVREKQTVTSCQNRSINTAIVIFLIRASFLKLSLHHQETAWLFKSLIFMQSSWQQLQHGSYEVTLFKNCFKESLSWRPWLLFKVK